MYDRRTYVAGTPSPVTAYDRAPRPLVALGSLFGVPSASVRTVVVPFALEV